MDTTSYLVARDISELHEVMRLVPRSGDCVKCDDTSKLQCPSCSSNESCQFTVPLDCTQCPTSFCAPNDTPSTSSGKDGGSGGPSAGPIAGGVIGGLAAIAIITYLVWRFLIKPKRQNAQAVYGAEEGAPEGSEKNGNRVTRRGSTHTVHSIASTVLTRASNIIQIAYIPGVTNRATPTSPNVLVPPVPPIPMHHTEGYRDSEADPHFFVPGNLRDSTYSGISAFSDRTSFAPPRSSVASTIFGGGKQQVLTPAQTGMRAKPTMVSVKSGSSAPSTPPIPNIDFDKFNASKHLRPTSAASNFSVGSTFLNSANTVTQARAQVVKVGGSGLRMVEIASKPEANTSSTTLGNKSPETTTDSVTPPTSQGDSSKEDQGPFSDPPEGDSSPKISVEAPSSPSRERAATKEGEHTGSQKRDTSPFGDEHEAKD
ncbi:hypothetical protein ACSS6W_004637 [Trichoderma asperelloides]|uniref:Protein OPY2 n=1 Tax=Trichoderma asperellum TaxID=101201 RepID=A0A6V8QYF4_TRIAP|nr:hypothetical protein LI328DRAFT_126176 [Trichoderma asperelloides]GFP56846.1 protein OPY2 [Trichoderma asperellum]